MIAVFQRGHRLADELLYVLGSILVGW